MFKLKPLLIMIVFGVIGISATAAQIYAPQVDTFDTSTRSAFVNSMHRCIDNIYHKQPESRHFPRELIIAQAILESGYGKSRLAKEANNLFGIRTWDKNTPHVKPTTHHNEWHGWAVKAYNYKCDSVKDVVRILNDLHFYEELRRHRDSGASGAVLAYHLDSFSTNPNYAELLIKIIDSEL